MSFGAILLAVSFLAAMKEGLPSRFIAMLLVATLQYLTGAQIFFTAFQNLLTLSTGNTELPPHDDDLQQPR